MFTRSRAICSDPRPDRRRQGLVEGAAQEVLHAHSDLELMDLRSQYFRGGR